jgi:hypothetical protein
MAELTNYEPGDLTPESGHYQLLNVFETPTEIIVRLEIGDTLPAAPRCYTWRLIDPERKPTIARSAAAARPHAAHSASTRSRDLAVLMPATKCAECLNLTLRRALMG